MVGLEKLEDPAEIEELRELIERHVEYTGSERAKAVLADWQNMLPKFVKVIPHDYKRVLQAIAQAKADGLDGEEAINAAFEANSRDLSRVGGN
jgi:glutamate synthase (ferredoxin)